MTGDLFTNAENRRNGVLFDPQLVRPFKRKQESKMDTEQRAKFEAWAADAEYPLDPPPYDEEGNKWDDVGTCDAWEGWCACCRINGVAELVADNTRLRTDWTNAMFEAVELGTLLKEAHQSVCSIQCLSQWKTSEGQRHSLLCQRIAAALAKHEGNGNG